MTKLWVPLAALAILAVVVPEEMYRHGLSDVTVGVWGTWVAIVAVLVVALSPFGQAAYLSRGVSTQGVQPA
jgi:hypothetical protein